MEINRWEIELVILNLIKNAAEATHEVKKPKIEIVLTEDEHHAIMRITDNGKGSQDVPIDEMFRPLFSTKTGGMGLGLSIAESVAESHGGRLNARQNTGYAGYNAGRRKQLKFKLGLVIVLQLYLYRYV